MSSPHTARWLVALLAMVALLAAQSVASAANGLRIDHIDLEPDGSSRLVYTAPSSASGSEIRLWEDGELVTDLVVTDVTEPVEQARITVGVAIDTSGSTAGEALAAAKTAAAQLVTDLVGRGADVVLISFADQATVLVGPTRDLAALQASLDGLEAGGDTALNDAVLLGARTLLDVEGTRRLLLFTDGRDEGSEAALGLVVEAVRVADLPVASVVLETENTDVPPLEALAQAAGGTVVSVSGAAQLTDAFQTVAQDVPSVHEVTWTSQRRGADLAIRLEVGSIDEGLIDEATVVNPRRGVFTAPRVIPATSAGWFATSGLPLALGLLAGGLLGLLAMLFWPRADKQVTRSLEAASGAAKGTRRERLREAQAAKEAVGHAEQPRSLWVRLTSRVADVVEVVPSPTGYDDELARRLERAGWSLRPAEFQVARIFAAALGFVVVGTLAQNLIPAGVAAIVGFLVPGLLVERAHQKRQDAFVEQMPEVLQLIAGSLKAGYGLVQAMDLVIEESKPPVSIEFRRVLNEHLLGLELEDALDAMADRIDSEDLRWVVVAMNIQRRVGGNLAELLEIVAATLRERAAIRRHVRALSAEGRLSARVLTAMPFVIGGYVGVVNPDYISLLFTDSRGRIMLVGALLGLGAGTLWMRKLVEIEV